MKYTYMDGIKYSPTLTITHDRKLSHYIELKKGDTIVFHYRDSWWSDDGWLSDWEGTLSSNSREGYETYLNEFIHNLFECVDIELPLDATFEDAFRLLETVFSDDTIPYKNIY